MRPRVFIRAVVAGVALSPASFAQPCPAPCNGTQIVCHHQNGIRNHRGTAVAIDGPNAATGNVLGDAEWKIWACENGMSRGSGITTFTNWEIGAANNPPVPITTGVFDIPDLELRSVVIGTGGVKEPDLSVPPLAAFGVGTIALPSGAFRINVSISVPTVAVPGSCPAPPVTPTLSNADVAMLFLYTPGEVNTSVTYYRNLLPSTEVNTISNPSVPPTVVGNSYSGTVNGLLGVVTHRAINQELYGEMGFYEPTLEVYRQTTGFAAPTRGSGAREFAPGDVAVLVSLDWGAGAAAINGQDRRAAVVFSDTSGGSPLCLIPTPAFLQGSLFLPGSPGVAAIFPTPLTAALLSFSATPGLGMNCHVIPAPCTASGIPSVFSDMVAQTPPIVVPPGLAGGVVYAAALYVNLTSLTIEDGSNTVELLFL